MADTSKTTDDTAPETPEVDEGLPLPSFERDEFVDRGYYVVCEFQDEKRRRDRAAAVAAARRHPGYMCLMTRETRLLHRTTYLAQDLHLFRELYNLIVTWASPKFYLMGYPIEAADLLRGLECWEKMGSTCNPLIDTASAPFASYFGCPRASISLKYMHPKVWYSVFYQANESGQYERVETGEETSSYEDLELISRQYAGCPLVHLPRLRVSYSSLPECIETTNGRWRIAPDLMGNPSLQPRGKSKYYELLGELELRSIQSSDAPAISCPAHTSAKPAEPAEAEEDPAEARRRKLKKYTWLLED